MIPEWAFGILVAIGASGVCILLTWFIMKMIGEI